MSDAKTEQQLINDLFSAQRALIALGWREIHECPFSGYVEFIDSGSTGTFQGWRDDMGFWSSDESDVYPANPILWRPISTNQPAVS